MKTPPGYLLPDDMPETFRCFQIYVPDDELFYAALWGSIGYLATWLAWERTDDKRGKDAAALWKTALEMSRDAINAGCGEDMILRQHPDNMCLLQWSDDEGLTWHTFADMTYCPAAAPPALYTETSGSGLTASEQSIDDILWYLRGLFLEIDTELGLGTPLSTIKSNLAARVWSETGRYANYSIDALVDLANSMTQGERDTALLPVTWLPPRDDIGCTDDWRLKDTEPVTAWLSGLAETIYDALDAAAGMIFDTLNEVAQAIGGNNGVGLLNGGWAAAGGGAGFGFDPVECPQEPGNYVIEYDFTEEPGTVVIDDPQFGHEPLWIDGQGWAPQRDMIGNVNNWTRFGAVLVDFAGQQVTVTKVVARGWRETGSTISPDYIRACWETAWPYQPLDEPSNYGLYTVHTNDESIVEVTDNNIRNNVTAAGVWQVVRRLGKNEPPVSYITYLRVEYTVS